MANPDQLLEQVCINYDLTISSIDRFVDSSHGVNDLRYNYVINQSYVVKMNTSDIISETFLNQINALVKRYRKLGLWCPKIIQNKEKKLLTSVLADRQIYHCYVEECAPYRFSNDNDMYILKRKMIGHLGQFASVYTNVDLADHYSMWSVIDRSLMDESVDEKKANLNHLVQVLEKHGYQLLAKQLSNANQEAREQIKKDFDKLPRCVFQGDLNPSNLLVDEENDFAGFIDFNMFGTEVNINCFINEAMYYLKEKDFDMSVDEMLDKAFTIEKDLLQRIFQYYSMNSLEEKLFKAYWLIIHISFYPNVLLWTQLIENHMHEHKVIELIQRLMESDIDCEKYGI